MGYKTYKASGYGPDTKLTHKDYIEDFRTCEKHNIRLHKAIVGVEYGIVCLQDPVPQTFPHAYHKTECGGSVEGPKFMLVLRCPLCQREFKEYTKLKRE